MRPISLNCGGRSISCVYSRIGAFAWRKPHGEEDWPRGEVAKGKIEAVAANVNLMIRLLTPTRTDTKSKFCDSMFGLYTMQFQGYLGSC